MRVSFEGDDGYLAPLTLELVNGVAFPTSEYIADGYTNIEILCIGACGGRGGINNRGDDDPNNPIIAGGGGGGGGGLHYVAVLLSALPAEAAVVVGVTGASGNINADRDLITDGEDGGYSSFNIDTCCASGGKGGKGGHTHLTNPNIATLAVGGDGGIGNSIVAGGGADGGPTFGSDPNGRDGTWDGSIGEGGGGGYGGVIKYDDTTLMPPGEGGRGSYRIDDTLFYGPRGAAWLYSPLATEVSAAMMGGRGGGAKATKLNNLLQAYGQAGPGHISNGLVLVRLTKV